MIGLLLKFLSFLKSYLPAFAYKHVSDVDDTIRGFNSKFMKGNDTKDDTARRNAYTKTTEIFYNLITDFYEWGWGRSFHFAPRYENESFPDSIRRYEHLVASLLNIPMDKTSVKAKNYQVLDVGCGVGGPMRTVAQFFNYRVHITGINITAEHIRRCEKYNKAIGLKNWETVLGDFNAIPRPDGFFDAIYDFEATLHSTDRVRTFKEIFRVLKPGGRFVTAQYCLLDAYDPKNETHLDIIRRVDNTNGCYCFGQTTELTTKSLEKAGFRVISNEDVFSKETSDIPFHEVFEGARGGRFTGTKFGLWCTYLFTYFGEMLHVLPKGTCEVQSLLMGAAQSFKEAGRLNLLTPGMLYVCEKPKA